MSRALYTNVASATLLSGIGAGATSVTLNAGQGSLFPSPTNGDYFWLSFTDAATKTNLEIVQCTGRVGDVLTIVRGQQSTSALSWLANDIAELRVTATGMTELWQNALHGAQQFTSNGSFVCPSGVFAVNVTVVGGSGGGAGGAGAVAAYSGGGGGSGASGKAFAVSVTPFSSYSVVVGTGGTGGAGSTVAGTNGSPGNTSTFTASLVYSASGGSGGAVPTAAPGGRTITNCTILTFGQSGITGTQTQGGDGGAGISSTQGTAGGSSYHPGGAGLSGGGGGGSGNIGGNSSAGGNGGSGYVLVEW
jgi:hypothetical protein